MEAWAKYIKAELLADWIGRSTPYTLRVRFDDNAEETIDFQAILAGELYGLHEWPANEQAPA